MSDVHSTSRYEPVGTTDRPVERPADRSDDHLTIRIPKPGSGGPMRSALRTTEFWLTIGLVFFVLLATYVDEDTLNRVDGWRFATYAVIAYVVSRGIAKFGNHADAAHDRER